MSINVNVGNIIPTNVVEVGNEISADQLAAITAANSPSAINPFATASHIHTIANISGLQTELDKKIEGNHTQPISSITNLQNILDSKSSVSHTHGIGEVTGLVLSLEGKASVTHSHIISDVSGLQAALDGKADAEHTHPYLPLTGGTITGEVTSVSSDGYRTIQIYPESLFNGTQPLVQLGNTLTGQYTVVTPAFLQLQGIGGNLTITNESITFPDGTTQSTAATSQSFKIEDYDNGKTYNAGDQVIFSDKIYKFNSFIGAAGYAPDTHPESWTEISASSGGGGDYLPLTGGVLTVGGTPQINLSVNNDAASLTVQDINGSQIQILGSQITFADGTIQYSAYTGSGNTPYYSVVGTSNEGFSVETTIDTGSTGEDSGKVSVTFWDSINGLQHRAKLSCGLTDVYGWKQHGLEAMTWTNWGAIGSFFKFGWWADANSYNGAVGWKLDQSLIFPDGTVQSTAYTGGGGGGSSSEEQRMADFVAGSIGGNVNYFYGWTDWQFYCPWVWVDSGLYSLYPPNFIFQYFISSYGWGIINDSTGTEYPVVYFDGNGFNAGDMPYESSDNWRVYVKDSSNTPHKSFRFYNNV